MAATQTIKSPKSRKTVVRIETPFMPGERNNWIMQKEKLARMFDLTFDELSFEEGKKDEMLERLEIKLNKTKAQLNTIIASL